MAGIFAKFKCDKKPQKELESQLAQLFNELGVITIYEIKGSVKVGFYHLPIHNGAFNTLFKRDRYIEVDGVPYCAIVGAGDMDELTEHRIGQLLSHLMWEYNQ